MFGQTTLKSIKLLRLNRRLMIFTISIDSPRAQGDAQVEERIRS